MELYHENEKFKDYFSRDLILKDIGYSSYKEYLKSDLWKSIRDSILTKHTKCFLCNNRAIQLHHKSYTKNVLLGLNTNELVPLCVYHHNKIEYNWDINLQKHKNSLKETNKKLCKINRFKEIDKIQNKPSLDELMYGPLCARRICYKCGESRICYDYSYLEYIADICSECKKEIVSLLDRFKEKKYKILTMKNWLSI